MQQQQQQHGSPNKQQQNPVGVGEMPLDNASASNQEQPQRTSAPPIQEMEKIQGYDVILSPNVTFVAPPPPTYQDATAAGGGSSQPVAAVAKLSEDEARGLLVAFARSKPCWGTGAAEGMRFKSLEQSTAVHYVLKTFLESRSTDWASEPFEGQAVDGPQNGTPPAPWSMQVPMPEMFHDTKHQCEVPHTASVRVCHCCKGDTLVMCLGCRGLGLNRCNRCHGSGRTGTGDNRRACRSCRGSGKTICILCIGQFRVPCPICNATGQVKCFVQLTTAFKTHVKDLIIEKTPMPNYLIRNVTGTTLFEATQPLLHPIQGYPEQEVNSQSVAFIREHKDLEKVGRIWMQNHVIRGVPVFQCDCTWMNKEFQYYVYGGSKLVYSVGYPQTSCCSCQLL